MGPQLKRERPDKILFLTGDRGCSGIVDQKYQKIYSLILAKRVLSYTTILPLKVRGVSAHLKRYIHVVLIYKVTNFNF